jgi:hypothetical protein
MAGGMSRVDPIQRFRDERRMRTDAEIIAELRGLAILPDEDDVAWDDDSIWETHAYVYLALADLIGERRLREGVPLLLERACYGDPGEIMRGLRHTLEAVYNPDWNALEGECIAALRSAHPGARFWAANELAIVGDVHAISELGATLYDECDEVRSESLRALERIALRNRSAQTQIVEVLRARLGHIQDQGEAWDVRETMDSLLRETAE